MIQWIQRSKQLAGLRSPLAMLTALALAPGVSGCSDNEAENVGVVRSAVGETIDLTFRITGVKTGTAAPSEALATLELVTNWDGPPIPGAITPARVFQCGTDMDVPCAVNIDGQFHPYPEFLQENQSAGVLGFVLSEQRYIKTKTVSLDNLPTTLEVDFALDAAFTQGGQSPGNFALNIATRTFEPNPNSSGICGFRHNGSSFGQCGSAHSCSTPTQRPECSQDCVFFNGGWELCYDIDQCANVDDTCDDFDDDCDGEIDEDVPTTVISCQDGSACRAMGTRVCQEGAFVDQCNPAPVIDFLGTSCPTIPTSTFTTEGMSDTDSDGIPDLWETNGFDANCDGDVTDAVDLPFHLWGANPLHKDLFVEFDWMTGEEPRRGNIQAMKDAFANAPVDAGGTSNPDGLPGINLFVDTGALVDASGSLVGDNLGGGNAMSVQYFSRPDARFNAAKCANFNPIRERFFRYGISARRGGCLNPLATEDGGGPGSCQNVTATGMPMDDSADGQDAYDTDCQAGGSGFEDGSTDPNSCTDSEDNGADDLANCADPDCHYDPGADEGGGPGTCSNGMDDDGDNKIDSADGDHCHYANGYSGPNGFIDHSHFGITIMHELGHMLGLGHGGPDKLSNGDDFPGDAQDRKPNHLSIMHNGNWPGIRLRTSEDASLVANSCFDGIDNGGMGDGIDIGDTNCQVGHDVWGPDGLPDGIPDGVILDYSPPRRTDGSRAQLPNLDETDLSEAVGLDPLDSRNLFAYVGYDPTRLEDGKNTCGDGNDNGGDGAADNLDTDCFIGTVFVAELPEDNVSSCNDGMDNGGDDGADQADRTSDCRRVFINAVDGDNDGNGSPDALAIDWQLDNLLTPPPVEVDINGFWDLAEFWDAEENLLGADDWRNLKIRPAGLGGAQTVQVFREPTILEVDAQLRHERGTDLGVSFDALPTGIGLGQPTPVRVTVVNLGPRRAAEYRAVLHLPPGVTLDDPNCSQAGSRVECPGSNLGVRDADVFTVTIRIGPNPVSAVRTLGAEVEVVDAENLNAANNLFGRVLVEPSRCDVTPGVQCQSSEYCDNDGLCKPRPCNLSDPFVSLSSVFPSNVYADGLTLSPDGLSAYVSVGATNVSGDIYAATRPNTNSTFTLASSPLGNVNSPADERGPRLSSDGLRLYFSTTNRPGSQADLVVSSRPGLSALFGSPQPLSAVNDAAGFDLQPSFGQWEQVLYFASQRPGSHDIYSSTFDGSSFSPAQLLTSVSSTNSEDSHPVSSRDGLRIYFRSKRIGPDGDSDGSIYMAQRGSTTASFGTPTFLTVLNTSGNEFPVALSPDECSLFIGSNRHTGMGGVDVMRLYEVKRATPPSQVTMTLTVTGNGTGSVGAPFNCSMNQTCSVTQPYGTQLVVWASRSTNWIGGCAANGAPGLSTDGVVNFTIEPSCTVQFP